MLGHVGRLLRPACCFPSLDWNQDSSLLLSLLLHDEYPCPSQFSCPSPARGPAADLNPEGTGHPPPPATGDSCPPAGPHPSLCSAGLL